MFSYFFVPLYKFQLQYLTSIINLLFQPVYEGPGWLNGLGRWILQLIQAYHQYGVGSRPAL